MDTSVAEDAQSGHGAAEPREQGPAASEQRPAVPITADAEAGASEGRAFPEAPARSLTKRQRIEAALDRNDELLYLIEGHRKLRCTGAPSRLEELMTAELLSGIAQAAKELPPKVVNLDPEPLGASIKAARALNLLPTRDMDNEGGPPGSRPPGMPVANPATGGGAGQPPLIPQPQLGMPLAMCMKLIENKMAYEKQQPVADETAGTGPNDNAH